MEKLEELPLVTRSYRSDDYQEMLDLFIKSARSVWPRYKRGVWDKELDDIEGEYIKLGGDFIVGLLNDKIVAMGGLKKKSDTVVELVRMRVDPDLHRQGLGQKILAELEKRAQEKGFNVIELHTSSAQVAAQKLYEKNSYVEVGRKKAEFVANMTTILYKKDIA